MQVDRRESASRAGRSRRPIVGLAALLVVVVVGAIALMTREAEFDVASATDVEIVEEFVLRLNAGDPLGAAQLVERSPSIDFLFPVQGRHLGYEGMIEFFEFYAVTGGRTDLGDCSAVGVLVTCQATQVNALWERLGAEVDGQVNFSIDDGAIDRVTWNLAIGPIAQSRALFEEYKDWILEERPDVADQAISSNGDINTSGTGPLHLDLFEEFMTGR